MPAVVVSDPNIPGVIRVSTSAELPGPHVGLFGSIHGNERCGEVVVSELARAARAGTLLPKRGTLVLVLGNLAAIKEGSRHTRHGTDLNRLFDYRFEKELEPAAWTVEHHRAIALRPVFEQLDLFLDLHSTTEQTEPFAIINDIPEAATIARDLGLSFVTQGWSGPGLLIERVSIGFLQRRGLPAISVECGQHDADDTVACAWDCTLRFLEHTGLVDAAASRTLCDSAQDSRLKRPSPSAPPEPRLLALQEIVHRPSSGFRFARALSGLDQLAAGELLASDKLSEMRVKEGCYVLMPNPGVGVGGEMVFLATEVPWAD